MNETEVDKKDNVAYFFLSSLSHELRTPLNGVVGYTQLLSQTDVSPIQKTYLLSMNKCCIQLMGIINDILDYSRLTLDKMRVRNECFSIKEIIDTVMNTMDCRIKEKKQKSRCVISRNLPTHIVSDKQKLIQVLVNLVSNANKFTNIGGFISIHVSPKESNVISFTVKDNGIGISKEDQEKLFDAFYQVDQAIVGENGSGLGLAISQKLVALLGGELQVESSPGKGSSFFFTITCESRDEFGKKAQKHVKGLRDKYVLVVDDNPDNRIILNEMLFGWKMRPVICASAKEALSMISRYDFAIGLIDICMPGMTGTDLAKQIKENNPTLPLIALSSLDGIVDSVNFDQVLNKPVHHVQLLLAMEKIIGGSLKSIYIDEDSNSELVGRTSTNIRILIVDDIEDNVEVLKHMLRIMEYTNVDDARNGEEAIEMIDSAYEQKTPYDIIFLDLRMPGMDGFEVIKYINKKNCKKPKIAVVTASVLDSDRDKCKELGIKFFILKPIDIAQIRGIITCI